MSLIVVVFVGVNGGGGHHGGYHSPSVDELGIGDGDDRVGGGGRGSRSGVGDRLRVELLNILAQILKL